RGKQDRVVDVIVAPEGVDVHAPDNSLGELGILRVVRVVEVFVIDDHQAALEFDGDLLARARADDPELAEPREVDGGGRDSPLLEVVELESRRLSRAGGRDLYLAERIVRGAWAHGVPQGASRRIPGSAATK